MRRHLLIPLAAAVALSAAPSAAEVTDAAAGGFTTRYDVIVPVAPGVAWTRFVDQVGRWWSGEHTVSGVAGALYIEARPMGCFCESLGGDAGLVHMTVTFVEPGGLLRLTGGLGPLGLMGVTGNLTVEFEPDVAGATRVTLEYAVGGYRPGGLAELAPAVDGVLAEQLDRYRRYVETGKPEA